MGCYFTLHGSPITPKGPKTDNTGAWLGKTNFDFPYLTQDVVFHGFHKYTAPNTKWLLAVTVKLNPPGYVNYSNSQNQHSSESRSRFDNSSTINLPVQQLYCDLMNVFKSCAVQTFALDYEFDLGVAMIIFFYFKVIGMISFSIYFDVAGWKQHPKFNSWSAHGIHWWAGTVTRASSVRLEISTFCVIIKIQRIFIIYSSKTNKNHQSGPFTSTQLGWLRSRDGFSPPRTQQECSRLRAGRCPRMRQHKNVFAVKENKSFWNFHSPLRSN